MQQDQPAAPAGGEDVLELVVLAVAVCCGVGSMLLGAVRLPTAADERAFWRSQRTRRLLRWCVRVLARGVGLDDARGDEHSVCALAITC